MELPRMAKVDGENVKRKINWKKGVLEFLAIAFLMFLMFLAFLYCTTEGYWKAGSYHEFHHSEKGK